MEKGEWPQDDNPLKNAPHTAASVIKSEWTHPYPRELAAAGSGHAVNTKYWPSVGRVDNVYGDRNLFCSCVPIGETGLTTHGPALPWAPMAPFF